MRRAWVLAVAWAAVAGCGRGEKSQRTTELSFETLSDTTAVVRGAPLLTRFEPYRLPNGLVRVRGEIDFPNGTRLQVSIYRKQDHVMVARMQMPVDERRFESPPILGEHGPLPAGDYVFELLTFFNETWQPADVLVHSDHGLALHGPGMKRDRAGGAVFLMTREGRL
ncbi:MAG TPA: hypothetical protein VL123_05290 [Candidatus Udaeobacter sp.]|jgi:hypothetical protein|nr:hypothetical protein [Candidatus Udaeobacter sp.]